MSAPAKRSSKDTQEKDLMLDKDMEKDTWDFKSMTDDDPMDFGFDAPANKKKNAFKLDMGFDLDGDFGNLSSFKMDMPDFDFSSPAKKTPKTKESSDDKSSGNLKEKKNPFTFSYDFDALDDFDLDSSPPKKGSETKTKTKDREETSARRKVDDKSDDLDFGTDLPTTKQAASVANTDVKAKASAEKFSARGKFDMSDDLDFGTDLPITRQAASVENTDVKAKATAEKENLISKTTDTMVVDSSKDLKQAPQESMENFDAVESPQGLRRKASPTRTMCLQPQPVNTSPLKTSCPMVKIDEPCLSDDPAAPSPLHTSETTYTAANRETSPDSHEICRSGTKEDFPRDPEENANDKRASSTNSSYDKSEQAEPNFSSQICSDKIEHQQEEMSTGSQEDIQDHTRRTLCGPDAGHFQTTLSGKVSPGTHLSQTEQVKEQDSSAKLPLAPSHSVPGHIDLKAMQNKDSGIIRSKFFKKTEKPQSHVPESTAIQKEIRPVTRERIGWNMNPTTDKRHDVKDALPGSKTRTCPTELAKMDSETANVNTSSSHEKIIHKDPSKMRYLDPKTITFPAELVKTDSETANVNTSSSLEKVIHKDHSNAKTVENVAGMMDHLKLQANISSKLDASSLTQKLSKHLSSGAESLQKSKITSLERPKLGNIMSDLRAATQRTIGVNKDRPSSAVQPQVGSSVRKERNTEAPAVKKSPGIHHLSPRDKTQILHCPSSLKRKALDQDADRSLKPQLKRFSMSPRENRNVEEVTHRVAQGKFSSQGGRIDNNTTTELVKESPRTKSHHQMTNMANLEIPITENNDNIEKAEAYTKELDNICNILKKKHEEAKELLVRAVVNNNKLLMLNHPLNEDKIRMVQKFAATLTLRDTQTSVA